MKQTTTAIGYAEQLPVDDPRALEQRAVELDELGPHDLLVEVAAVSVNPVDVKLRAGAPSNGFRVLGFDAAGTVAATGSEVSLFGVGDEVMYAGSIERAGSNQRLQLVDERIVGRKPEGWSFGEAASLPLTAITAWESLFDRLRLAAQSEGTLLVVGATGGVGSIMVELAEALLPRVRVIATASGAEAQAWVRELGAEHAVDHRGDLVAQLAELAPGGVDWIFTAHSQDQVPLYARLLKPFGAVVAIDDGPRDVEPLKAKSAAWHWEFMFTRARAGNPDMGGQHRLLQEVAALAEGGALRPLLQQTLGPIDPVSLREAHRIVEGGRVRGKVVVAGWPDEG